MLPAEILLLVASLGRFPMPWVSKGSLPAEPQSLPAASPWEALSTSGLVTHNGPRGAGAERSPSLRDTAAVVQLVCQTAAERALGQFLLILFARCVVVFLPNFLEFP